VSKFNVASNTVIESGESFLAPNAHVVAVDPSTREIYFPLMNVNGKPVLRIMRGEEQLSDPANARLGIGCALAGSRY
jgi:hypothetical protein